MSFVLLFKVPVLFKSIGKKKKKNTHTQRTQGTDLDLTGGRGLHRLMTGQSRWSSGLRGFFSGSSKDTCDEPAVTRYCVQAQCSASQRATVPLEACTEG